MVVSNSTLSLTGNCAVIKTQSTPRRWQAHINSTAASTVSDWLLSHVCNCSKCWKWCTCHRPQDWKQINTIGMIQDHITHERHPAITMTAATDATSSIQPQCEHCQISVCDLPHYQSDTILPAAARRDFHGYLADSAILRWALRQHTLSSHHAMVLIRKKQHTPNHYLSAAHSRVKMVLVKHMVVNVINRWDGVFPQQLRAVHAINQGCVLLLAKSVNSRRVNQQYATSICWTVLCSHQPADTQLMCAHDRPAMHLLSTLIPP